MKERAINLCDSQVLAALDGRLTRVTVPIVPQPVRREESYGEAWDWKEKPEPMWLKGATTDQMHRHFHKGRCPHPPGTVLVGRERFWLDDRNTKGKAPQEVIYDATPEWCMDHTGIVRRCTYLDGTMVERDAARKSVDTNKHWHRRSSATMPRWASRFAFVVQDVRVQRVGEISPDEVFAEGIRVPVGDGSGIREYTAHLRDSDFVYDDRNMPCCYQVGTTEAAHTIVCYYADAWQARYGKRWPWPDSWVWTHTVEPVPHAAGDGR